MEELTEDERRALRGSKFAPLPSTSTHNRSQPRQAHPAGPMRTNKAAALSKFLERKLQEPKGLASIDPKLVELAVKNAKETVQRSETSASGRVVHHVKSFGDDEVTIDDDETDSKISASTIHKQKKKKKKQKNKKKKNKKVEDTIADASEKPKKKVKL